MSEFLLKSYSRSTETSFFPWKSQKIEKSIFLKMVDFSLFFCNLYFVFAFCVLYFCLFVFSYFCIFSIFHFQIFRFSGFSGNDGAHSGAVNSNRPRCVRPSQSSSSSSNVYSYIISFHVGRKNQFSRNLLKEIFDFFFCQAQLCINVYYCEEKIQKSWKMEK